MTDAVVGILVGGRGRRLGGVAKGLLRTPDARTTLIERVLSEVRAALPDAPIALLGQADAYRALDLPTLADSPPGVGPLGGLISLLELAAQHGKDTALCLTCDLPRVERSVLGRLAREMPSAFALVTAQAGVRNPLVARYRVAEARLAAKRALLNGSHSVQGVLDALGEGVATLPLTAEEELSLADWDVPEDLRY